MRDRSDKDVAHRLSGVHLTERLTDDHLTQLSSSMPGAETRHQLLVLADLSAFLAPPSSTIIAADPPTDAEEHRMLSAAADVAPKGWVNTSDFQVTRNVTQFQNLTFTSTPNTARIPVMVAVPRFLASGSEILTYRHGVQVARQAFELPHLQITTGVETWDGLAPLFQTVLNDIRASDPKWLRWERGIEGRVAVFQYRIPGVSSHLNIPGCWVPDCAVENPGYEGEITLDPTTGDVYRLTVRAGMKARQPISRVDLVLEFGIKRQPGQRIICPVSGIAFVVSKTLLGYSGSNLSSAEGWSNATPEWGDVTTLLDIRFSDYISLPRDGATADAF